jgi:hypothetical protein
MKFLKELVKFLDENPKSVFIVLTVLFGYGYYDQSMKMDVLLFKVGGLEATAAFLEKEYLQCELERD